MTKFDPSKDIPDLAGKTIVVTGGNTGLGAATIEALVARNVGKLFLCARTPSKADAFISELKKTHANASSIQSIKLDLTSFDSIKTAANEISASCDKIQTLFLNAGISALPSDTTKEGYEVQFGVNHVGHALLTQLLVPKLIAASKDAGADVRVISVSSVGAHNFPVKDSIAFDQLKTPMASEKPINKYGQSKLANILFAKGLAKQYPFLTTSAPHPGLVITEIWGKATAMTVLGPISKFLVRIFGVSPQEGAKNQLWCAYSKDVRSGDYYEPIGKPTQGIAASRDDKLVDKLWDWTTSELAEHGAPGWPEA